MNRQVEFQFNGQLFKTGRIIGDLGDAAHGPTLVFFGAIHGNEPSGVIALQNVFRQIEKTQVRLNGRILGLAGNLEALAQGNRFVDEDLNRIWTRRRLAAEPGSGPIRPDTSENREQEELNQFIQAVLDHDGNKLFFDLHTTSSASPPFIAINDQLANRDFASKFPVSIIFGIEEYLDGPLLSYLNDFGHVAFAFEAGQHYDFKSVDIQEAFIKLCMLHSGLITESEFCRLGEMESVLSEQANAAASFFEIVFRQPVDIDDDFKMQGEYRNFDPVSRRELLATNRPQGEIRSQIRGRIFMPLYQPEGEDGFFLIRRIPRWALWISRLLRRINFETFLTWLPGIQRWKKQPDALLVDKRVAVVFRNQLFHLLGFRRKQENGTHVLYLRREVPHSLTTESSDG